MIGRREFFKKIARTGLLAGLVGASAAVLTGRMGQGGDATASSTICNGCIKAGSCTLPRQQVAFNIQADACNVKSTVHR